MRLAASTKHKAKFAHIIAAQQSKNSSMKLSYHFTCVALTLHLLGVSATSDDENADFLASLESFRQMSAIALNSSMKTDITASASDPQEHSVSTKTSHSDNHRGPRKLALESSPNALKHALAKLKPFEINSNMQRVLFYVPEQTGFVAHELSQRNHLNASQQFNTSIAELQDSLNAGNETTYVLVDSSILVTMLCSHMKNDFKSVPQKESAEWRRVKIHWADSRKHTLTESKKLFFPGDTEHSAATRASAPALTLLLCLSCTLWKF